MKNMFSINLNYIKRYNGLNNSDLMNIIGLTSSTVSNLLNDKSIPNAETLLKLSQEFNYSVDDLLKTDIRKQKKEYDVSEQLGAALEPVDFPLGYTPKTGKVYKTKTPLENALRHEIDIIIEARLHEVTERLKRLEILQDIDHELENAKNKTN